MRGLLLVEAHALLRAVLRVRVLMLSGRRGGKNDGHEKK